MIHVVLRGRLGNHLFQYAVGRHLATLRGTDLALHLPHLHRRGDPGGQTAKSLLSQLPLRATLDPDEPWTATLARAAPWTARWTGLPFVAERSSDFSDAVLEAEDETWLYGFFQSRRYFDEGTLRADLSLDRVPIAPGEADVGAQIDASEAVAVHVRRADYLGLSNHRVITPRYYAEAFRRARAQLDQPRFFVFSDDLSWCRQNLTGADVEVVDIEAARDCPLHDLRLMSRCRHHVIANSTFSWWGAWLADRQDNVVMVPDRWYADPVQSRAAMAGLVLPHWTRIPA